jgi:glycerate kinase
MTMPLKVLVVPDKFKGTLTATEASGAITRGWMTTRPEDRVESLPMSDGGDGFGEVVGQLLGASLQHEPTIDAAHQPIDAAWWWSGSTKTAVVESARVVGLAMLPPGRFQPFDLDTYGLGAMLRALSGRGAKRCLVGIGGSATNDGGFGLACALGWQFFSADNTAITHWGDLSKLSWLRPPEQAVGIDDLVVAVDVQNPLLGPAGCSRIYGPQKGLVDIERAERALERLALVVASDASVDHAAQPGAGAAGGLGFGFLAFAGARLERGIDLFRHYARLEERIRDVHVVITGEGAIDAQTRMGKGVGEIARLCRNAGVPCIGVAGVVADGERQPGIFTATYAMTPDLTDPQSALHHADEWLERAAAAAARDWSVQPHDLSRPD